MTCTYPIAQSIISHSPRLRQQTTRRRRSTTVGDICLGSVLASLLPVVEEDIMEEAAALVGVVGVGVVVEPNLTLDVMSMDGYKLMCILVCL